MDLDLLHFSGPSSESFQTKRINFQKVNLVSKWKLVNSKLLEPFMLILHFISWAIGWLFCSYKKSRNENQNYFLKQNNVFFTYCSNSVQRVCLFLYLLKTFFPRIPLNTFNINNSLWNRNLTDCVLIPSVKSRNYKTWRRIYQWLVKLLTQPMKVYEVGQWDFFPTLTMLSRILYKF